MKIFRFKPVLAFSRACASVLQIIIFAVVLLFPLMSSADVWETRASGNWTASNIWKLNGSNTPSSPNTEFWTNDEIYIYHDITYNFSWQTLFIGKDGEGTGLVEINGGSFFSSGNNGNSVSVASNGILRCYDGDFELGIFESGGSNANGNLEIYGTVHFENSTIKIAQNWQGKEGANRTVINCCMQLGENYQAEKCTDYNENFCLELGLHTSGNFQISSGDSEVTCLNCDILWPDAYNATGDFNNSGIFKGTTSGTNNNAVGTLYVRSGNLTHSGSSSNWTAAVNVLYVSGNIDGVPSTYLNPLGVVGIDEDQGAASSASCNDCSGTPLPIQLLDFDGKTMYDLENHLYWATAAEINSDYFEVQKETNEMSWTTIGMLPAKGNSSEKINYSFIDLSPVSGFNYYRLKMVDISGNSEYSHIVVLQNAIKQEQEFSIYPSPAEESVNLMYRSEITGTVDIQIVNHLGQVIHVIKDQALTNGTNRMVIDIQNLVPGWYALQMKGEGVSEVKSFVKN